MAEEKYTWENLIFNPITDEAKNAVGKEVYYSDEPLICLEYANKNNKQFLNVLDRTEKRNNPFYIKENGNWACIIVKKEDPYSERAKKWIEENNLKVGDYVKVLRKTELYENRWGSFWVDEMSDYIGKALKVLAINSLNGLISLECDDTGYDFPYFVIEKIEPPKLKYVPFESKEEFIEGFHYHDTSKYSKTDNILLIYGMWLRSKNDIDLSQVTVIKKYGICIDTMSVVVSWKNLLNDFEFLDGTPCGKESKDV